MQTQDIIPASPLLPGLLKLSHAEKLRVVNLLLREIAAEEGVCLESSEHTPDSQENYLDTLLENPLQIKQFKHYSRDEIYADRIKVS